MTTREILQRRIREVIVLVDGLEETLREVKVADLQDYVGECKDVRKSLRSMHIALEKDA